MIRRRCLPLSQMSLRYASWSGVSGPAVPSRMTSEKPMIELSGVLSSWVMFDRNSDFALFAASASSLALLEFAGPLADLFLHPVVEQGVLDRHGGLDRKRFQKIDIEADPRVVVFSRRRSTSSTSLSTSSVSTRSTSACGSSVSRTWATSGLANTRITCATASTPRMSARKRLPSPSPRLAPSARPAMSTTSMVALTFFGVSRTSSSRSRRGSGTATTPRFDSADVKA